MKLTKRQKETLITFNEKDDRIEVLTQNRKLVKKLTELSDAYPDCCAMTYADKEIGRYEFSVSKNCFSFRVAKPYSRERKDAMRRYSLEHNTIAAVADREKENVNVTKE